MHDPRGQEPPPDYGYKRAVPRRARERLHEFFLPGTEDAGRQFPHFCLG